MRIRSFLKHMPKTRINGPESFSVADFGNISTDLDTTLHALIEIMGNTEDLSVRRVTALGKHPVAVMYISGLVDKQLLNTDLLKPIMQGPGADQSNAALSLADYLSDHILHHCEVSRSSSIDAIVHSLLDGNAVLIIDRCDECLTVLLKSVKKRTIAQPETEQVIRGPREGFIESLDTNVSLLRYRLKTPNFRMKTLQIGNFTKSKAAICYLHGVVNPALVQEVERRLQQIQAGGVLDTGMLEQYIEDNHVSPFPQMQNTERPDKAVSNILEGRVVILLDGSPFALIAPSVFTQFYQTAEDYNERFITVSFIRLARLVALMFSLIFPSLYVAVISFNPELIPTEFAVAVAGGRAGVPFPSVVEVLLMETAMEVLREATIRLPQQVGGALSIVGVLVVGEAAVSAGFASPITVVVIALTTIGSFATPAYNAALALRLLRFPLIILAGMFGLYGVMIGLILITNHLLSLRSFGVPYVSPLVPGSFDGMKDTVIRSPLWWMRKRPEQLHPLNPKRIGEKTLRETKQQPNNTLDPVSVGNEKENNDTP